MDRAPAPRGHRASTPVWRRTLSVVVGIGLLVLLVRQVGAPAFVDGLRRVDLASVVAGVSLTAVATVACAWRWRLVAGALGLDVPLRAAVPAYYRSQFLNSTVPGGVVGDVHRGMAHGIGAGDRSAALRAVAWERAAGQAVQLLLALLVFAVVPSRLGAALPVLAAAVIAAVATGVVLARRTSVGRDLRLLVSTQRIWPRVLAASVVVVAAHAATFVVAARAAGVALGTFTVLQLGVVVLLAMAIPLHVAGFGPREGVAAWAFAAVGAGAAAGVTVAVVYGVLAVCATLPGVVALVAPRWRRRAFGATIEADGIPRRLPEAVHG